MKASDIRRGHVIMVDGQPCRVMDFQHRTPGNLRAFVQVRFRNLNSGNTFDTRLSATDDATAAANGASSMARLRGSGLRPMTDARSSRGT